MLVPPARTCGRSLSKRHSSASRIDSLIVGGLLLQAVGCIALIFEPQLPCVEMIAQLILAGASLAMPATQSVVIKSVVEPSSQIAAK